MMIFWVVTFYAVYEGMGCKRSGRRELLNNKLPKNTWGKKGIVHWAEGMPVLLVCEETDKQKLEFSERPKGDSSF